MVYLQQSKRDAAFKIRYVKGVPFVTTGYTKGVPFLSKITFCNNNKIDTMTRSLESIEPFLFFFRGHLRSTLAITCGLGNICGTVQCSNNF